jgi:type I restriction enzyme M protein
MSEELIKRGLLKKGITFGKYEYYNTHDTTINQYKNAKILVNKSYGEYSSRKPDGLIINRNGKSEQVVIAVIEYKKPSDFKTDLHKKKAVEQCNDLCQVLGSKIGIITDGEVAFWINPLEYSPENLYLDRTTNKERSYSFIRNEDKKDLSKKFYIEERNSNEENLEDESKETYNIIQRILSDIDKNNSQLKSYSEIDPINLAKSVWQDIYVNTAKDPTKCLYNVVEIFIFKFLSDLGVLVRDKSFDHLIEMYKQGYPNKEVLEHYAQKCRKEIRNLFPEGEDGTTIINGTIFVDPNGNAVSSQSTLFKNSLLKYNAFGSSKHIKKEFKTKLFETFLKQSQDKSKLGQFFTPRKIVQAIVGMADIEKLTAPAKICDPFCGVGGFLLEPIHHSRIKKEFIPIKNKISPRISLTGYDRGTDKDEERTIILAKANMLIYLSEIIEKYPLSTKNFAKVFNDTFHLLNSNIGTLGKIFDKEEDKIDLILTNPPYITSGVSSMRKEIEEENLSSYYSNSGKGVEGMALKWIIENLKKNGRAFIIIPDSILTVGSNKDLRKSLIKNCNINCLISLPTKTFFNTPKKTYILGITKKIDNEESQVSPVFTYLVSNIGETRNVDRFEIEGKSDLEKAKESFNQFKGSPDQYQNDDPRCKIQQFNRFDPEENWAIDKWWSKEEVIQLGIEEEEIIINLKEFKDKVVDFNKKNKKIFTELNEIKEESKDHKFKEVDFFDIFKLEKGKSTYTKKYVNEHQGDYPVYSSNTKDKGLFGYADTYDFDTACIYLTTNGVNAGTTFYKENHKFSVNGDGGVLTIKDKDLDYKYLLYELRKAILPQGFNWENKPSETKLSAIKLNIPIKYDGEYDLDIQKKISNKQETIEKLKEEIRINYETITSNKIEIY